MDIDLTARIDALEMRLMRQDQTIDDLNETITAQWRLIDRLQREVTRLDDLIREGDGAQGRPEPPPPHY